MLKRVLHLFAACLFASSLSAQCSVDIAQDTVTVYFGYEPLACAALQANATGAAPLTFLWSTGATPAQVLACDEVSTWYYVSVTDAAGCTSTDSVFVNVVDVHCGNNNNKVLVCHIPPGNPANAHTICISENGVPAHLAHGCRLGACVVPVDSLVAGEELQIQISPNPMYVSSAVSVTSSIDQRIRLSGIDALGRELRVIYEGTVSAGVPRTIQLQSAEFPERTRMVWIRVQGASGTVVQRAVVMDR